MVILEDGRAGKLLIEIFDSCGCRGDEKLNIRIDHNNKKKDTDKSAHL